MSIDSNAKPVAMVTGGARGIGLAIGKWFLAHGYRVALLDRGANARANGVWSCNPAHSRRFRSTACRTDSVDMVAAMS